MLISCKLCGYQCKSLILDQNLACSDIVNQLMKHATRTHSNIMPEFAKQVVMQQATLATVMSLETFANIPMEEEYLHEQVEKGIDGILTAMGVPDVEEERKYDEMGEDDEGEEEEEMLGELGIVDDIETETETEIEETSISDITSPFPSSSPSPLPIPINGKST